MFGAHDDEEEYDDGDRYTSNDEHYRVLNNGISASEYESARSNMQRTTGSATRHFSIR